MSKKTRIAYVAVIAISVIVLVVFLVARMYSEATIIGIQTIWLILYYSLLETSSSRFGSLKKDYDILKGKFNDISAREVIRINEFNKMRKRAEDVERKYQALVDDTPARGPKGRYVKRKKGE